MNIPFTRLGGHIEHGEIVGVHPDGRLLVEIDGSLKIIQPPEVSDDLVRPLTSGEINTYKKLLKAHQRATNAIVRFKIAHRLTLTGKLG